MIAAFYMLSDKKITIPARQELIAQLGSIRETVSDSGTVLYHSRANAEGHADKAWAILLATEAGRDVPAVGNSGYQSVSRRSRWDRNNRQLNNFLLRG